MGRTVLRAMQKPRDFLLTVSTSLPPARATAGSVTARIVLRIRCPALIHTSLARFYFERTRVERYLAAVQGYAVPTEAEWRPCRQLPGFRLLPTTFSSGPRLATSAQRLELPGELRSLYRIVEDLLERTPPDTLVGRAIENVGQSALDIDPDLAYLHAWNGVELLGKDYYLRSNPTYDEITPLGTRRYLKARTVVPPLVRDFFDGKFRPDSERLEDLRNTVAHGGRGLRPGSTRREFEARSNKLDAVIDLGRGVLINYLGDRGLIPNRPRPFLPKIAIPSWRVGSSKIRSVDTSKVIAHRVPIRTGIPAPRPLSLRIRRPGNL